MGNRNANQIDDNNRDNQQILIQNDVNNNPAKIDPPSLKKIVAVRNPFSIKKSSLILEKDAGPTNIYYIKFLYDSNYNFNCYINFEVTKNPAKQSKVQDPEDYTFAYSPSPAFESKKILIKNVPKGEDMEFFEKNASIDIDYFKSNKSEIKNDETFDMSIELVPIMDNILNDNDVVFISLCNFDIEEIGKHPHSLKIEQQKLKTYGMWIDIHDIYNSALESGECFICCAAYRNTIFLPCNHACTCNTCAHSLKMRNNPCPVCKNPIKDLLIIEVDEKTEPININIEDNLIKEEKKEDIINVNEENINISNNENPNIIRNDDNIINEENNIINNTSNNIEDEEKEKINEEKV